MNLTEIGQVYKIEYGPRFRRRRIPVCDRISHEQDIQKREQLRVASQLLTGKPMPVEGSGLIFVGRRP